MTKTIGVYGAVGTYDFGDNAMMIRNINNLFSSNKNSEYIIFTPDIKATEYHCNLYINQLDLLHNIYIVDDGIKKMNPIDIEEHGIKVRVFDSDELNQQRLDNIIELWNKTYIGDLTIVDCDLIQHLKKLDLLIFNGGGYIQNGWGDRVIYFMSYINIAHSLGIPIYFLGNSFGPLHDNYLKYLSKSLPFCNKIMLRDGNNYSKKLLESIKVTKNVFTSSDDMIFECQPISVANRKGHIIIEVKGSISVNSSLRQHYIKEIVQFITIMNQNNTTVYLVNFSKMDKNATIIIDEIKSHFYNTSKVIPIYEVIDIENTLDLFQNAEFVISIRYHPLVFALGCCVQCVALLINKDEYYRRKFYGCFDSLGLNGNKNIIDAEYISTEYLLDAYQHKYINFDKSNKDSLSSVHTNYINSIVNT